MSIAKACPEAQDLNLRKAQAYDTLAFFTLRAAPETERAEVQQQDGKIHQPAKHAGDRWERSSSAPLPAWMMTLSLPRPSKPPAPKLNQTYQRNSSYSPPFKKNLLLLIRSYRAPGCVRRRTEFCHPGGR